MQCESRKVESHEESLGCSQAILHASQPCGPPSTRPGLRLAQTERLLSACLCLLFVLLRRHTKNDWICPPCPFPRVHSCRLSSSMMLSVAPVSKMRDLLCLSHHCAFYVQPSETLLRQGRFAWCACEHTVHFSLDRCAHT